MVFKKQMGCRWVLLGKKNCLYKVLINMLQRGNAEELAFAKCRHYSAALEFALNPNNSPLG